MPADDWQAQLNDNQRRAVNHDAGPLIVLAGPGTGKTRVLVARIRRLLDQGSEPESILALTFSIRAAEEMRERLAESVGDRAAERIVARTFHSLGRRIIARFADMIGARQHPVVMDSAQTRRLARSLAREQGLFNDYAARGVEDRLTNALRFVSSCRHAAKTPSDASAFVRRLAETARDEPAAHRAREFSESARFFTLFEHACLERGWATLDDFLALPLRIFAQKPIAAVILQSEFRHVLVDEFQDVNAAQIELTRRLAPPINDAGRPTDLCVVGDDDQAIYAFRGAAPDAFDRFAALYPRHTTIALTGNYRSATNIVSASNAVIEQAEHRFKPDKRLVAESADGAPPPPGRVEAVEAPEQDMGQVIAAMILDDRARNPARLWSDFAVIARTNPFRDALAAALELAGIPVDIGRKPTPADDPAVQDLLAWLRLLADPSDSPSAQRLLVRPPISLDIAAVSAWKRAHEREVLDERTDQPFCDWLIARPASQPPDAARAARDFGALLASFRAAASTDTADRVVERIIREAALADAEPLDPREHAKRIGNLVQVIRFIRSRQPYLDPPGNAAALVRYYADLDDREQQFTARGIDSTDSTDEDEDPTRDAVRVLTAHSSKGLEFHTVFVARVSPGNGFPLKDHDAGEELELPADFTGFARPDHLNEERRVFYVACTRAERRLVLLAKHKKKNTHRSDFFWELTRETPGLEIPIAAGSEWLERSGTPTPDRLEREIEAGNPPGTDRQTIPRREIARQKQSAYAALREAEAAGQSADPAALAAARARADAAISTIAALAHLRHRGSPPDPLPPGADAAIIASASERCRQPAHLSLTPPLKPPLELSYSKINDYDRCPRCFYVKYALGLDEPTSDALLTGSVTHDALRAFFTERRAAEADGRLPPPRTRLLALAAEIYRRDWPMSRPFDIAPLRRIEAQLSLFLDRLDDDAETLHLEQRVELPYPCGPHTHRLIAKFDRVDRLRDGRWRIVDYKTGEPTKNKLEPKDDDLQLGIYALALSALLGLAPDEPPSGVAEYWILSTGERGSIELVAINLKKVRTSIDKAIIGMLDGRFPRGANRECKGLCAILGDEQDPPGADQ